MTSRELIAVVGRQAAHPEKARAPKALELHWETAVTATARVLLAAAALTIAVWIIRRIHARRLLRTRVSYSLLPTLSFDPSKEDVSRFALQLTRTRPAESRFRPRRGSAVRITLGTDDGARLTYRISGPRHAESVLRHPTYAEVELLADDDPARPARS